MIPLSLKIQAFGPYLNMESINFSKLGRHPLFLLHGPTGSGKSTILDAICYALFGETSNKERKADEMRTTNAKPNLKTEVSFDFQLGDTVYQVSRSPRQMRYKKNGTETTHVDADATLIEYKNSNPISIIKKIDKVNEKIREILGLTVEQFRQVILLPQGKFRELLHANSADREIIFSKLFQTDIYKQIENTLKDRKSEYSKLLSDSKNREFGLLSSANVNNIEDLNEILRATINDLSELESRKLDYKNKYEILKNQFEIGKSLYEKFELFKTKKNELKDLELYQKNIYDLKEILVRSDKANYLLGDYKILIAIKEEFKELSYKLSSYNKILEKLLPQKENIDEEFKNIKLEYRKVEEYQLKKKEMEDNLNKLLDIDKKRNLLLKIEAEVTKLQNIVKKEIDEKGRIQDNLNNFKNEERTLSYKLENFPILIEEIKVLDNSWKERSSLLDIFDKKNNLLSDLNFLDESIRNNNIKLDEKNQLRIEIKLQNNFQIASKLASDLVKDTPCPVCGSLEHPNPHVGMNMPVFLEKGIDEVEDEIRSIEKNLSIEYHKKKIIKEEIENIENIISTSNILNFESLKTQIDELKSKIIELNIEKDKIQKLFSSKKILSEKIEKEELNLKVKNEIIEINNKKLSEITKEETITRAQIDTLKSGMDEFNVSSDSLNSDLQSITSKIEKLTNAFNSTEKKASEIALEFNKAESERNQILIFFQDKNSQFLTLKDSFDLMLRQKQFQSEEDFKNSLLEDDKKTDIQRNIQEFDSKFHSLKEDVRLLEIELSDKSQPSLDPIEKELENISIKLEEVSQSILNKTIRKANLENIYEIYTKIQLENQKIEDLYGKYGHLAEVACGLTGERISLQRFILSVLLDDVLTQASLRLKIMSRGRYNLVRREEKTGGNKSSGLDLEIEDEHTGGRRTVQTLSGGESFLAALSLALGLSDVVQSTSGGIHLDTLFIDEGFGSLDPESLELAIRALYDLKNVGRTIGIISHVSELKEQIPLQIEVLPLISGSTTIMKSPIK